MVKHTKTSQILAISGVASLCIALLLLLLGWFRDHNTQVHMFDTGLYLQLLNNLARDGSWSSSITGENNFLAHHFQPLIILLQPLVQLINRPFSLFLSSAICVAIVVGMIGKHYQHRSIPATMQLAIIATIWLHPTIANRLYHSFVPEILALPALTWIAFKLAQPASTHGSRWELPGIVLCQILAALTKETMWILSAWTCLLFAINSPRRRYLWIAIGSAYTAIFVWLFVFWMPTHTNMPSYYGWRYFAHDGVIPTTGADLLRSMFLNLLTLQSLKTLMLSIGGILCFAPFWQRSLVVWAALPTVMMILTSSSFQHVIENHYLLPALPFFWVAALENSRIVSKASPRMQTYLSIVIVLVPLSALLYSEHGVLNSWARAARSPKLAFLRADLQAIEQNLAVDARILIDGNLQPAIPRQQHVQDIVSFLGNPRTLDDATRSAITDVISRTRFGDYQVCADIQSATDLPSNLDVPATIATCKWLTDAKKQLTEYPQSGLFHYRILDN